MYSKITWQVLKITLFVVKTVRVDFILFSGRLLAISREADRFCNFYSYYYFCSDLDVSRGNKPSYGLAWFSLRNTLAIEGGVCLWFIHRGERRYTSVTLYWCYCSQQPSQALRVWIFYSVVLHCPISGMLQSMAWLMYKALGRSVNTVVFPLQAIIKLL